MPKRHKIDTLLLAVTLFSVSGAVLAYNIYSSDGGGVTVSLSELIEQGTAVSVSLIHEHAEANLTKDDTVYTSAEPTSVSGAGTLLPPIVTPPTE